jgi:hypothetical protein
MWRPIEIALFLSALTFSAMNAGAAPDPKPELQRVSVAAQYAFPVYANHPLNSKLCAITRVILVQHGIQRNGDDYFAAAAALAKKLNVDLSTTLIIAPNFFDDADASKRPNLETLLLWHKDGWMAGEDALPPPRIIACSTKVAVPKPKARRDSSAVIITGAMCES